jgi:hypothetical protein
VNDEAVDGKKTEKFQRELDGWFAGSGEGVPFWERANIRAQELKDLRLRMQVLEAQVKQLEGENDAQEAMIGQLFEGLGFQEWEYSLNGARDAIRAVSDLAAGRISPEAFGRNGTGSEALPEQIIRLLERQWVWHRAAEQLPDPDIEVLAYDRRHDTYFSTCWDGEGWVCDPEYAVTDWCDPIPPALED